MPVKKLIACFDIINGKVTKAKNFFDNVDVAPAEEMAAKLAGEPLDGIIFFDVTASNEKRRHDFATLKKVAPLVKVTLTVGGGIKTLDDMNDAFEAGADKISIDSMAVRNPDLIADGAKRFGSERIVLSTQIQKVEKTDKIPCGYEVYIDGARVATGLDAMEWVKRGEALGAGEVCLNSIDRDGTLAGFDIPITGEAAKILKGPVIASGGAGKPEHLLELFTQTKSDSAIISSMLYSPRMERNYTATELKQYLRDNGIDVTFTPTR